MKFKLSLLIILALLLHNCSRMKQPLNIGHRGAMGHETENTIASVKKALALNVDMIEIDVFVIKSGELVVFHDEILDSLTDTSGKIEDFTLEELQKVVVKGNHQIPTLDEVIETVDRLVILNIELKGVNTANKTFDLVESFCNKKKYNRSNFLISSFQIDELKVFSELSNDFPLAVLTQASIEQSVTFAQEINAKAIHPHFSLLTEESCYKAKELGLQINTWTVNEKVDIEHVKRFSIDGIISDYPDRI